MRVIIFFVIVVVLFFVLNFNPQWHFSKKVENQNITFYHNFSQPYNFETIIEDILYTLKKSKLYNPEYRFQVYITTDEKEFCFYSFFSCSNRYYLNPFINAIYIAPSEIHQDKLKFVNENKYDVVNEIKKAIIYSLILHRKDILSYLVMRNWKKNGYAEYIISNIPAYTEADLCNPSDKEDYYDYENRMCVKYIIEEMNLTEEALFDRDYAYQAILDDVKMKYCRK